MTMENKKNVPEIRFKGFDKLWNKTEMSEVATFNPKAELPEIFEYVDLESVVGTEMISHRTEHKLSAPSRAQRLAKRGDLFYQTVRPYQKNNYLFDKDRDNYVFSTGYAQLRPHGNGCFLLALMQGEMFIKTVLNNCTGTSYPAISSTDLSKIKVSTPDKDEQKAIGNYFQNIDRLINTSQTKLDKLKTIKKACLEKMFPKNGSTIPKLRFKGFAEEWKPSKLNEILRMHPFKPYLAKPILGGKYAIIQQGDNPIVGYANGEPFYDYKNVVLFGDHTLSLYKPRAPFFVATDGIRILSGDEVNDGDYLLCLLVQNRPNSEGYKRYYSSLVDKQCCITINQREQIKIGRLFKTTDDLIAKTEQKINKLKNIKKACLAKMFVNTED